MRPPMRRDLRTNPMPLIGPLTSPRIPSPRIFAGRALLKRLSFKNVNDNYS